MRRLHKIGKLGIGLILISGIAFWAPKVGLSQGGYDKYPEKPITLIYGWGSGGMQDITTRLLTEIASKDLGQPIVIEYKPGSHGIIATHTILSSKPDGYTLGASVASQFTIAPHMQKVDFDPMDPTHILVYMHYDLGLVVRADSPWKTWEEFKSYAKANPGKIRYGTTGVGTGQHLTFETIAQKEGINWVHMPFRLGGPAAVTPLLGGHIEAAIQGPTDILPHIQTGKLRLLLVLTDERWPSAPDVPAITEKGYKSTFSYCTIYGPKGLPDPIRSKLANALHKATQDPKFVELGRKLNIHLVYMDGKEYTKLLKERIGSFTKIIQDLGLGAK
jgi:tripartite-type tricarboxylate transporter receptor subunit TctC